MYTIITLIVKWQDSVYEQVEFDSLKQLIFDISNQNNNIKSNDISEILIYLNKIKELKYIQSNYENLISLNIMNILIDYYNNCDGFSFEFICNIY